jgi:hypothetical protein
MKTNLKTVIFSLSSSNIRNANGVFLKIPEKTKEQLKLTKVANKISSRSRDAQKPGACVVITSK